MTVIFVLISAILVLLVLSFGLERYGSLASSVPRKILHIGAISVCAASVYLVPDRGLILIAAGVALPLTFAAVWYGFLKDRRSGRRSWGMVYFIAVFLVLTLFCGTDRPELVFYPMAVLAFADGFATVAGEFLGKRRFTLGGDERSFIGSSVFFLFAAGILLFAGRMFFAVSAPDVSIDFLLFIAAFLTVTEATSSAGRDNIWVPLALAYWLFIGAEDDFGAEVLWWSALLSGAAYFAFRKKWLSAGGAAAAALMGAVYLVSPQPIYFLPPLLFFGIATLLSLLPRPEPGPVASQDAPRRTAVQVWANGGPGTAALMLWFITGADALALASLTGFSAALSDTASSEVGSRFSRNAWSAVGLKRLEAGVSGGVSVPGSIAGLLFAGIIPLAAAGFGLVSASNAFVIAFITLLANYGDSVAGQFLQEKILRPDGAWTDAPAGEAVSAPGGWRGMTNDAVNALTVSIAVILAAVWFSFRG